MLIDTTPIAGRARRLQPLELRQVRRTRDEPLFNSLMEQHHYLGYEQPVGEHLKYLVVGAGPADRVPGMEFGARVIWAAATATSAGARKRGGATSASSPTTRAF